MLWVESRGACEPDYHQTGNAMSCLFRFLTIALIFALPGCAEGQEIGRMAGVDITLGEFTGILYYLPGGDGYHVVATVNSGERATPLRFSATLTPGQSVVFSVPGKIGEPEQRLEVVRTGDRVFVTSAPTL
jgi:hypothetical protein